MLEPALLPVAAVFGDLARNRVDEAGLVAADERHHQRGRHFRAPLPRRALIARRDAARARRHRATQPRARLDFRRRWVFPGDKATRSRPGAALDRRTI